MVMDMSAAMGLEAFYVRWEQVICVYSLSLHTIDAKIGSYIKLSRFIHLVSEASLWLLFPCALTLSSQLLVILSHTYFQLTNSSQEWNLIETWDLTVSHSIPHAKQLFRVYTVP